VKSNDFKDEIYIYIWKDVNKNRVKKWRGALIERALFYRGKIKNLPNIPKCILNQIL
jgi:hypothetical protein